VNVSKTIERLAILGCGNIGGAIARGLARSGRLPAERIIVTRRKPHLLSHLAKEGFTVQSDNLDAVRRTKVVILAVDPQHLAPLVREIAPALDAKHHVLISVVSGASTAEILALAGKRLPVVRAMPNTAIAIRESMTCLAAAPDAEKALSLARSLFDAVGRTLVIDEDLIVPATALCACGTAFFMRAIRAASQGGIEIGFHASDALTMAAQTAKGAAGLLLSEGSHPEGEIDKVTTPRGCTIAGLNEMEHEGFSSAMIRGIVISAEKAAKLYVKEAT
jgi:pyrroline-5-carboxylate reductase